MSEEERESVCVRNRGKEVQRQMKRKLSKNRYLKNDTEIERMCKGMRVERRESITNE